MGSACLLLCCRQGESLRPIPAEANHLMRKFFVVLAALTCPLSVPAYALPALQAHLTNSVAGDQTLPAGDQDTWFNTYSGPAAQQLELIASYGVNSKIKNISDGYLVLTVSPNDPNPAPDNFRFFLEFAPGILTEILNIRDYRYEDDAAFETALTSSSGLALNFNGHSPYGMPSSQVDVYGIPLNVLVAGLGNFDGLSYKNGASPTFDPATNRDYYLKDCNADTAGTTGCTNNTQSGLLGEIKTIGFKTQNADSVHVDFVAKVTEKNGRATTQSWTINPGSHDSTISVPEPGSLGLIAAGMLMLTIVRRGRRSS